MLQYLFPACFCLKIQKKAFGHKILNKKEKKTTCKYKRTRCNIVVSDDLQGWKSLQKEIRIMIKSRMAGSMIREIKEMEGFYDERKRKYYERKGSTWY